MLGLYNRNILTHISFGFFGRRWTSARASKTDSMNTDERVRGYWKQSLLYQLHILVLHPSQSLLENVREMC